MRHSVTSAFVGAALSALSLTACGSSSGGRSDSAACNAVVAPMNDVSNQFELIRGKSETSLAAVEPLTADVAGIKAAAAKAKTGALKADLTQIGVDVDHIRGVFAGGGSDVTYVTALTSDLKTLSAPCNKS